jgi:arginine decarboxylase
LKLLKNNSLERWTVEDAMDLYHIRNWGMDYFKISEEGNVVITPIRNNKTISVSLMDIISGITERGMEMPVLLRIENILDSQICLLHESFRKAIQDFNYQGTFKGVYPIKVNQQEQVLDEITRFGRVYHHGLEAGSKAELIAALSLLNDKEACLICNGYKDREFVDLVIEMPCELDMIIERANQLNIRPLIGIRIKLSTQAGGHWTESGGDQSIFGLNMTEVIEAIETLKQNDMLDCLKLLHYHLGSQIPNIRDIRSAVLEACRVYVGLVQEGAAMEYLDLGGGLAVDYDGSHTNFSNSRNYTIDEYCADIIESIMATLDDQDIPHPTLITESGRATVAYYSVLLFNVLDVSRFTTSPLPQKNAEDTPEVIVNMLDVLENLTLKNIQEGFNDALYYRDQARQYFKHAELTLRERALADNVFWHIIKKIAGDISKLKYVPHELKKIHTALADTYYCNFSIFQSLPDSWAIDHLFPVMPIHRLNEYPSREAIIADITCDCDGKINKFIDIHGVRSTLSLHELKPDEEYYLGVFLVGAYQETLGDLHNLFGDTNVVSIRVHENGEYSFVRELEGDTVADVLSFVEYNPKAMMERFRKTAEKAIWEGYITPRERPQILKVFEAGLRGYTYFER